MKSKEICLPTTTFVWYHIIVILVVIGVITASFYTIYIYKKDFIDSTLSKIHLPKIDVKIPDFFGENKQKYPERTYVGRYNNDRKSQQVGFLLNPETSEKFPLFENRLDNHFYYHVVDDSRNSVKIPFTTKRKEQIYNGDDIAIPEISNTELKAHIYDYPTNRF